MSMFALMLIRAALQRKHGSRLSGHCLQNIQNIRRNYANFLVIFADFAGSGG